jgi:hypothetical protein
VLKQQYRKLFVWTCGGIALIGANLISNFASADTPVRGFADLGYQYLKVSDQDPTNNFLRGAVDLFLTHELSTKVNFLAEINFEIDDQNTTTIDVERVLVQYHLSPWFTIGAGRYHTALGFWNDTYHHGSWLQTSISRPEMYLFEDDGGFLPVHSTGIEIRGEGDVGPGRLGYIANIANGRGPKKDPPQTVNDADTHKAVNLLAYYSFPELGNLRFGGNIYLDTLPGDDRNLDGVTDVQGSERIFGGHLLWAPDNLEILFEMLKINHAYVSGEADSGILASYFQASYHVTSLLAPYGRIEYVGAQDGDYYTEVTGTHRRYVGGLRFDFEPSNALKLEYAAAKGTIDGYRIAANWSFTF